MKPPRALVARAAGVHRSTVWRWAREDASGAGDELARAVPIALAVALRIAEDARKPTELRLRATEQILAANRTRGLVCEAIVRRAVAAADAASEVARLDAERAEHEASRAEACAEREAAALRARREGTRLCRRFGVPYASEAPPPEPSELLVQIERGEEERRAAFREGQRISDACWHEDNAEHVVACEACRLAGPEQWLTPELIGVEPTERRRARARDELKFRGFSLRTGEALERRLDWLARKLGLRRGEAAMEAVLSGLEAYEGGGPRFDAALRRRNKSQLAAAEAELAKREPPPKKPGG